MEDLFSVLGDFKIFNVSKPLALEETEISHQQFLEKYSSYVEGIKKGELIDESIIHPYFSSIITADIDAVYAMALSDDRVLVKTALPVIQMKRHHFVYSDAFYSGVMGKESISWGIQFSYPQLCLDPATAQIQKVGNELPNSLLFRNFAKWIRNYTRATPFIVDGICNNQPMRLGKKCFSWINHHPQLKEQLLQVKDGRTENSSMAYS